ncbi:MAG: tRNA threonylcarbamoyladenosine dehydratase [Clostridia bacterium]|nr:tRNA threonylcarbamoyladenosine dehydratase [Clostridia bacterium]
MNISEEHIRTAMLLGTGALERLKGVRIAVFGIGGVGSYVCEALARAGVGAIDLFDSDIISRSNINRQLIALHSTVGMPKVEVMRARILDINPDCRVEAHQVFYLPENADTYPLGGYDYIADAIDTVSAKIELAVRAKETNVPLISSMGTGNKLDPTRFTVTDLSKTSGCPLARVMRRELKARGITHLKVVYSTEPAAPRHADVTPAEDPTGSRRAVPGSLSFVPSVVGLILAGEIVKDLVR